MDRGKAGVAAPPPQTNGQPLAALARAVGAKQLGLLGGGPAPGSRPLQACPVAADVELTRVITAN